MRVARAVMSASGHPCRAEVALVPNQTPSFLGRYHHPFLGRPSSRQCGRTACQPNIRMSLLIAARNGGRMARGTLLTSGSEYLTISTFTWLLRASFQLHGYPSRRFARRVKVSSKAGKERLRHGYVILADCVSYGNAIDFAKGFPISDPIPEYPPPRECWIPVSFPPLCNHYFRQLV